MGNLKDFRVAVVKGQFAEAVLKNRVGVDNYIAYDNIDQAINALVQRKVDALFENQEVVNYILIQKGLKGSITPMVTNQFPVDFAYGVSKGKPELVSYINNRIAELQDSGVYEELFQKYFYIHSPYYGGVQARTWIRIVVIALAGIAAGAIVIFIYIKYLRKKILKINKELFERHEQLNVTLSSICDGVLSTDKIGRIEYINKTAAELLGYKDSEVLGRHINEIIILTDEASKKRREIPLDKAMDELCQIWIEGNIFLTAKEGSDLSVEASVSPIVNDNIVIGSVFVFHDITERKVSGDIIRQERNFSSNIVDHANIFILLINSKSELIKFNKYAQRITGFNEAEVMGNKWMDTLIHKEHINRFNEIMGMFFMGRVPPAHEFPLVCKDGRVIHGLWNNSIISDREGNPDTMICMGLDITERKIGEQKLAQSFQQLEAIHEELAATEEELRGQYNVT
jgi:PAS domain S-box-containing protein